MRDASLPREAPPAPDRPDKDAPRPEPTGDTVEAAVRLNSLKRRFGSIEALSGLDMNVRPGDIYGFLGRNGAGKTTAIRILAGLIRADSGKAELLGRDVRRGGPGVRERVGFLVETPAFFPQLSGRDNLRCHLHLAGEKDEKQIDACLDLFGLTPAARRKVGGYSLGMRQRLGLAQTFIGEPRVLILDEPSIGLDPSGVISVREIIHGYAADKGATFLVSSHVLGEVERLCTRIGVIEAGRMVAEGTLVELGAAGRITVRVSDPQKGLTLIEDRVPAAWPALKEGNRISLTLPDDEVPALVRLLVREGLDVFEVATGPAGLEDLYLDLVGKGGLR